MDTQNRLSVTTVFLNCLQCSDASLEAGRFVEESHFEWNGDDVLYGKLWTGSPRKWRLSVATGTNCFSGIRGTSNVIMI